jgi:hypothetical protein
LVCKVPLLVFKLYVLSPYFLTNHKHHEVWNTPARSVIYPRSTGEISPWDISGFAILLEVLSHLSKNRKICHTRYPPMVYSWYIRPKLSNKYRLRGLYLSVDLGQEGLVRSEEICRQMPRNKSFRAKYNDSQNVVFSTSPYSIPERKEPHLWKNISKAYGGDSGSQEVGRILETQIP